jgi:hypothetical protein
MVIRSISVLEHAPLHRPAVGEVEEQVVEHQALSKRGVEIVHRRVREPLCEEPPRRFGRAEQCVQVATQNAWALRQQAQQGGGLPAARCVAEHAAAKPAQTVLEMRRHEEDWLVAHGNGRERGHPRLPLLRKRDRASVLQRTARDDGVAAHAAVDFVDRHQKEMKVTCLRQIAGVHPHIADCLLQQEHVVDRRRSGEAARYEIGRQP